MDNLREAKPEITGEPSTGSNNTQPIAPKQTITPTKEDKKLLKEYEDNENLFERGDN